ncbi:MAG: DUF1330 domain-containing protein [Dongiaceae bacterium]
MPAYALFAETVSDMGLFDRYRAQVPETLEKFGGRFIVRGGNFTVVEGEWPLPRRVIIEFPSRDAAEQWYASPRYQEILPMRLQSSKGNFVIVDGV